MSDHLSKKDSHLYNIPPPKKAKREISSSTTLAFASQLSSLISSKPSTTEPSRGRTRPSSKADIFASHNKGAKKRALRDLEDDGVSQGNSIRQDIGGVDDSTLHRSKRKMEEKSKIYAAMKRGDHITSEGHSDGLIDFDRKWAETEALGKDVSSSEDEWQADGGDEIIEYEDEYGRMRKGTLAGKERLERKKRHQALGQEELDRMSARPAAPSQIIYGDTVQTLAFNPDEDTTYKMEELARKRDRSATPPEAKHYEADQEIRSRGTGFFAFSKDEATRKKEMEALDMERLETERVRREREEKKDSRRREIEIRRKEIAEKRSRKQADSFLEGLGSSFVKSEDSQ